MKKFIAPLLIGAAMSSAFAADDLAKEVAALKAQMAELKNAQSKINIDALRQQVSEIKAHDAGDNIKWTVDFRTAYDVVDYKISGGMGITGIGAPSLGFPNGTPTFGNIPGSSTSNGLWTNKLILGMAAQPADNLVFKGSLSAYSLYGRNYATAANGFQNFPWYSSETPDDNTIRLREAYFLYFGDIGDVHYSASFGRRPSVDGFMTNLRADNAEPASPVGHNINMEFDGASFKFDLDKVSGVSGMYFKICLGRGNSNAEAKYPGFTGYMGTGGLMPSYTQTPYANSALDAPDMDLAGVIFQAYDDGQYKIMANLFKGWNMMGADFSGTVGDYDASLVDVGDLTGGSLSLQVNGIGDGISDFLDDSIFFLSYAFSKTDPKGTHGVINMDPMSGNLFGIEQVTEMLGSPNKEAGYSYYAGFQFPGLMAGQRLGLEYNHGSKYWRSFTYGEDTLIGSKLAARGDAYEIYYTLPLVGKNLTAQLSYIYIDYDYTGSDLFFGSTGAPVDSSTAGAVESASNIRASIRYRY